MAAKVLKKMNFDKEYMSAGPMNPGAALIVKSCGKNISAHARYGALSNRIDHLTYIFVDSKS